jgi:CRP/FNR family transcriptional regulator, cyclic AMP receptor protein
MAGHEDLLSGVPIFSELKPKDLKKLTREAHDVSYPAGKTLTEDDEFGSMFFVVTEGTFEVKVRDRPVRALGPGDYFGEMALISKDTRSATVTATSDSRCLVFSRPVFRQYARSHPEVAWALLEVMVARVRDAEAR